MRVLIGGSHGLVGSRLIERLAEEGHETVRLTRDPDSEEVRWNPYKGLIDNRELEDFDAVIHLGGVSIGEKRWTNREKEQLWNSRIVSTETLVTAFGQVTNKPKTFICASAVGFYGDQGSTELTETSPPGQGFLADLCKEWETEASKAAQLGIRTVSIRSGVVFSADGGTLKKQVPLFRLGIGGRLGSGQQWMSWIDIDDEVNAIIHILNNDRIKGPVNLTSPDPLTNIDYTKLMASVLRRPAWVPAPRWMISLALGEQFADEVLLASQRVLPQKLVETGFEFKHANPVESLLRLLNPSRLHLIDDAVPSAELPKRRNNNHNKNGNGKHSGS